MKPLLKDHPELLVIYAITGDLFIGISLVILKLLNVLSWKWVWITAPLWSLAIAMIGILLFAGATILYFPFDRNERIKKS